ncbi:hypothetical protein [Maribacter sp. 2-571]|uniref:hypothetical protein n=1 Tax=Maribacter sp. 2-571 TaxID=3417569 RepID=UPI003D359236
MKVLRGIFKMLGKAKEGLWDFFDAFNEDRLHVVKPSDVLQKYVDFNIDDIEEFAATYTYDYHDTHRILDNKKSKSKMYQEVYTMMKLLEDRGSLDR